MPIESAEYSPPPSGPRELKPRLSSTKTARSTGAPSKLHMPPIALISSPLRPDIGHSLLQRLQPMLKRTEQKYRTTQNLVCNGRAHRGQVQVTAGTRTAFTQHALQPRLFSLRCSRECIRIATLAFAIENFWW